MNFLLANFLDTGIVPILKAVLDPLHAFLNALPPSVWRTCVCVFLTAGMLWTLFLSKESVYRGTSSRSKFLDLRLWVCVLAVPYLAIYLFI